MNKLTNTISDDCLDSFETLINTIFSIFDFKDFYKDINNTSITSDIVQVFQFIFKLFMFLMIFPAIPFYIVMAFALSAMKYLTLKLSLL
jgi:sensor histidine kinase YesM